MPTIVVDVFEPPGMKAGIEKYQVTVVTQNLVPTGLADIFWVAGTGERITLEHKTIEQVCSEMGRRLDDQLRKHTNHADEVGLITDGLVTPRLQGGCDFWKLAASGKVFYKHGHNGSVGYDELMAYLWSLDKQGVTVYQFPYLDALCLGVASFVYNSMKSGHKTLRRYTKTRPIILEENPNINPNHVRALMGLPGAKIGEITAKKLMRDMGTGGRQATPWEIINASPEDGFEKIGWDLYRRILKSVGRPLR